MAGPNDFAAIVTAILGFQAANSGNPLNTSSPVSLNSANSADDAVVVGMLMGAGLESDWRISAGGGGAFQISDKVSFSPTDINAAVAYMYPRYKAAVLVDASMPEGSAKYADIAYKAERPARPYAQSQGQAKVDSVYQTVQQNYGSAGASRQGAVNTVVGGKIADWAQGFMGPILSFLSDLTDVRMWRSLGWIAVGIMVFVIGLIIWLRKPIENAVGTVAKAAVL